MTRSAGIEPDKLLLLNSNDASWETTDTPAGNVPTNMLLPNDSAVNADSTIIDDGSVPGDSRANTTSDNTQHPPTLPGARSSPH